MSEKKCLIEVTELRAIGSDRDNWMVLKRTKKKDATTGKPSGGYSEWASYKYPTSFEHAASLIEEELIRTSGSTTLTELRRAAERIHAMMLEILKEGKLL